MTIKDLTALQNWENIEESPKNNTPAQAIQQLQEKNNNDSTRLSNYKKSPIAEEH